MVKAIKTISISQTLDIILKIILNIKSVIKATKNKQKNNT